MEDLNIESQNNEISRTERREYLAQPFDREIIDTLNDFCENVENEQRLEFANQPDMLSKLNVHYPTVWHVSKMLEPNNELLHLAARYHDYGRAEQFRKRGDFNDGVLGSDDDHHVLGYRAFLKDAKATFAGSISDLAIDESVESGVMFAVYETILLHGMRGKAFDEEFAKLDADYPEVAKIVDAVSMIDDIANGTQCINYLFREKQEQAKNKSKGGFIPDENAYSNEVTPRVMELFKQADTFNRNLECKTYPDYYLFGAFLAARNLKDSKTRELTKEAMQIPIMVVSHGVEDGKNVLISEEFSNTLEAFKWLFDKELNPEDAKEAYRILENYYNYGTAETPADK